MCDQWLLFLVRLVITDRLSVNCHRVTHFTSPSLATLEYLPQCQWWGISCCSACRAPHPEWPGTSQSSRRRRSCRQDSKWCTVDHSWEPRHHHWGMGAFPLNTQTRDGHLFHSHPPSQGDGNLVRSHSLDGHTSEILGFHHSCHSPVIKKYMKLKKWNEIKAG